MNDYPILLLIACSAAGGTLGWLLAGSRAKSRAAAAEASAAELRNQTAKKDAELSALRVELGSEQQARAGFETALAAEREKLAEEKTLFDEAREKLSEVFKALASDVLKGESQSFISLAQQAFEKLRAEAQGELGKRQEAIQGLVSPLREGLGKLQAEIQAMEEKRQNAYGGLQEQLRALASVSQDLQRQTGNLTSALKGMPQVRGRWGELALRRAAELAGMTRYCDFVEQPSVETEDGRFRPDMVVRMPAGRQAVVDAKVPLVAFLEAVEAQSEEARETALARHAQLVRDHMAKLGARRYWDQFSPTPDFVIVFLPGESFFSAALQYDRTLIEDGMEKRVILASPTTLIALLRAIAYGWQQQQVAESAQQISELGKQLYDRLRKLAEHFENLRSALTHAIAAYNGAVGSMELKVLPAARKFRELGATNTEEIAQLEPIDQNPRQLTLAESDDPQ